MLSVRAFVLSIAFFLAGQAATAAQQCECVVDVGTQNRKVWGSWALECNGHKGHGDCPTTNIDTMHSPGASAMTGSLQVYARQNGVAKASWSRSFPDDHITAFKGPVYNSEGWEWTNTCSCDTVHSQSNYNLPMFGGMQQDAVYVYQGRTKALRFPASCADTTQQITVHENIQENDPWSPDDPMGSLATGVPAREGTYNYVQNASHFEPAYINGSRTHAGYAGGSYSADIVVQTRCYNVGTVTATPAPTPQPTPQPTPPPTPQPTPQPTPPPPPPPQSTNTLSTNGVLGSGQSISSSNGRFTLVYQGDGNLVVYDSTSGPIWASNTSGSPGQLVMQGDGNLVIYAAGGNPIWATDTFAGNAYLVIQDDGNAVLYSGGTPLWSSMTGKL
ncbi:MAG: hypothetical protein ABL958_09790 [Bdellovibrionia bacterium]